MTSKLKKIGFTLACLTAFALGGAALAGALDGDDGGPVTGADAARAGSAAVRAAGGGEILSVDRSDDRGVAWDVDVLADGREVEVELDDRFEVVRTTTDRDDGEYDDNGPADADFEDFDDDRPLTADQARRAGEAALRVTDGGSVESIERSDDRGEAYEVEVLRGGREIDVALDDDFREVPNARYDD